jgi:hypothetical protein
MQPCRKLTLDIIRAEGALGSWFVKERRRLSSGSGTLKFIAEMPEVLRPDLELQNFFDHRREVSQRPDRTERRSIGRSRRTPRRRKYQRMFNSAQRHAAFIQARRKRAIRTAHYARSAGRQTIRFENPPHILALVHPPCPQPCGSRNDGPLMVTVWQ